MNLLNPWRKSNTPRNDHEKVWKRSEATPWDPRWQALSVEARKAYLRTLKPPTKGIATTQPTIPVDRLDPGVADELVAAGFARLVPGQGKKPARIVASPATHDFSLRLRSLDRYHLLGPSDTNLLTNYVKHAFVNNGEGVVSHVLAASEMNHIVRINEALATYVTTGDWPELALKAIHSKPASAVFEAIAKSDGPVKLKDLPGLVRSLKPKEIDEALTDLISHLALFEDLEPETLEILVGLLPVVLGSKARAAQSDQPAKLVVCEHPKEIGPMGGLLINDVRVFLLEVVGEAPRLKQDGSLFAREESRFLDALPPLPGWLATILDWKPDQRLLQAFHYAILLDFLASERDEKMIWLRLSDKGRKWLASGIEEQYLPFFEYLGGGAELSEFEDEELDDDDDDAFLPVSSGRLYLEDQYDEESIFFGLLVAIFKVNTKNDRYYSYYSKMSDSDAATLRTLVRKGLESLSPGVFYRWDSVLAFLTSEQNNPLTLGEPPSKVTIFLGRRQIPRLPLALARAAQQFYTTFMATRLLPFDAFRPAIDESGKLCVARLPRSAGYFGRPYKVEKEESAASTRVIVQPDFSVLVIGLDAAPAVAIAPFCDRAGGHAGQGALTFKITRESVVRGVTQGLDALEILGRLRKYASLEIPANVAREIDEWAGWVRPVNLRQVMVIRCPDSKTVDRVLGVLGKKAERLSATLAALHHPRITPAERQKLQDQGILITKKEIVVEDQSARSGVPASAPPSAPKKKRGRPKKVR